jgi:ribosome-binding protein aMBF1 (putative translation factor)
MCSRRDKCSCLLERICPALGLLQELISDTKWIMTNDPKLVKHFLISAAQMRAARGLLGWSQTKLATEASMSLPTVKRYETATGAKVSDDAIERLRRALESAGVEFIAENGGGAGVRLRKGAARGNLAG